MWDVKLYLFFTRNSKNTFIQENLKKNISEVEKSKNLEILVYKIFCPFSQFLNYFQLQVSSPSEPACWDDFFEYWNLYFTFLKAGVMILNILWEISKIYIKMAFCANWGSWPPKNWPLRVNFGGTWELRL